MTVRLKARFSVVPVEHRPTSDESEMLLSLSRLGCGSGASARSVIETARPIVGVDMGAGTSVVEFGRGGVDIGPRRGPCDRARHTADYRSGGP